MDQITSNRFSSMPFIPYKIIMALLTNDNFCKLVYYNSIDALSKPNLTIQEKRNLVWDGTKDRMDKYNIFLTNVQPNSEIDNKCILKCYRLNSQPNNLTVATVAYRFDILFGSKIPIVTYQGVPCNRGDLLEMEIMKTLNGSDVAGVGYLQYNGRLSALCRSQVGIGNNYTFTGLSIVMATQISDTKVKGCWDE